MFLQLELPFKVTSYLLLLEYVLCSLNLCLWMISNVVIYNGRLNKGQLNTATDIVVNGCRNRYVNLSIITQSCSVPIKTESQIFDKVLNVFECNTILTFESLAITLCTTSLSNGATARGGPRPPSRFSSILPGLGRLLSNF
jgi:hypothetical protein